MVVVIANSYRSVGASRNDSEGVLRHRFFDLNVVACRNAHGAYHQHQTVYRPNAALQAGIFLPVATQRFFAQTGTSRATATPATSALPVAEIGKIVAKNLERRSGGAARPSRLDSSPTGDTAALICSSCNNVSADLQTGRIRAEGRAPRGALREKRARDVLPPKRREGTH